MGHCSEETRELIKNLRKKDKTYKEIKETSSCSDRMERIINPSASKKKIQKDLNLVVNGSTVRRRMMDNNLFARSPKKVPLLHHA